MLRCGAVLFSLSVLSSSSLGQDPTRRIAAVQNFPVLCRKLQPLEYLNIAELAGSWVTAEALLLRDGYPLSSASPSKPITCVHTTVVTTGSSALAMSAVVNQGGDRRKTGITEFRVNDPAKPGRWQMRSPRRASALKSEFLVLAAVPSKYMVLAYCQPVPADAGSNAEEEGVRPALWVKILARRSSTLPTGLRQHVATMLGLRSFNISSVHFDTTC